MSKVLVSIHDVMPHTLPDVRQLMQMCIQAGVDRPTLLVVPGCPWRASELEQLRVWAAQGCELAGHGWSHHTDRIRGIKHRLHACLLSRNVAEHLSLSGPEIAELMDRCYQWFVESGFDAPRLYVPPAWALGRITSEQLRAVPFELIETLFGVLWTKSSTRRRLPLIGFEADTTIRKLALRLSNRCNVCWGTTVGGPIRIALHPYDHQLRLSSDMLAALKGCQRFDSYNALSPR